MGTEPIDYSREWYEKTYHEDWSDWVQISDADTLRAHYAQFTHYHERFLMWFRAFPSISGRLLELGFNNGKSMYWFASKYPELTIDGIDFSTSLIGTAKLFPQLCANIRHVVIGDVGCLPFRSASYEFVSCLDMIEHLPEPVYLAMLSEVTRVLVPGGLVFVHVGTHPQPEHIHIVPNEKVIFDLYRTGFSLYYALPDFLCLQKN